MCKLKRESKCDYPKEQKWKKCAVSQGCIKKGYIKTTCRDNHIYITRGGACYLQTEIKSASKA